MQKSLVSLLLLLGSAFAQQVSYRNVIAGDGIDNDGDGLVDEEYCYNGIDEDGDGLLNEDCAYVDICPLHGSTYGREFVATFLDNQPDNSAYNPMQMFVGVPGPLSSVGSTSVNISSPLLLRNARRIPATTDIKTTLNGRGVMLDVPYQLRVTDSGKGSSKKTLHIHTSKLSTVHGYNTERYTADSFLTIPANSLGKEYFAATYVPSLLNTQAAVVGLYTKTTVNVSLIRDLGDDFTPRLMVFFHGKEYHNGDSFLIKVDPYEVVHVTSEYDMSGTQFKGDKPFAFFSGNLRTWIRDDATEAFIQSRDHLVEQIPPVDLWGTQFVTQNFPPHHMADIVRIMGSKPGVSIQVKISNSSGDFDQSFTFQQAGMYRDIWLDRRWRLAVSASNPIMVAQYTHSQKNAFVPSEQYTDPSLIYVPPVTQFESEYVFGTATYIGTEGATFENYVVLTAREGDQYGITLDGQQLENPRWRSIQLPGRSGSYVQGYITVSAGTHRLRSAQPFGAIQWQVGDRESVASALGIKFGDSCGQCMQVICGDQVDNDCDGRIDEETCDGYDDDGDGRIDEDCYCMGATEQIYLHVPTTTPPPTTTTKTTTTTTEIRALKAEVIPHGLCSSPDYEEFQSLRICYSDSINIRCPDRQAISILSANIGRIGYLGETSCGFANPLNCEADDVACPYVDAYYPVVKTCNGQQYCTISVNSTAFPVETRLFPGACTRRATYLDVNYICANSFSRGVPACTYTPASRWLVVSRDMEITASSYASCQSCGSGRDSSCSSEAHSNCQPIMAPFAFDAKQAWCPSLEAPEGSWIQADLGAPYVVLGVLVQGRRKLTTQFVRNINVQVSTQPRSAFTRIITSQSTDDYTFRANRNSTDVRWISFEGNQTVARYVKIEVGSFADHPALHFEVIINNQVRGCEAFRASGTSLTGQRAGVGEQHRVRCLDGSQTFSGETAYTAICESEGTWSREVSCI